MRQRYFFMPNNYKNLEKKYQFVRLIVSGCYYILIRNLSMDITDNQCMSFLCCKVYTGKQNGAVSIHTGVLLEETGGD